MCPVFMAVNKFLKKFGSINCSCSTPASIVDIGHFRLYLLIIEIPKRQAPYFFA